LTSLGSSGAVSAATQGITLQGTTAPVVARPTVQLDSQRNCVNVNWGSNTGFGNVNTVGITYEL